MSAGSIEGWHTEESFRQRQTERAANPQRPEPLSVWYHVACMNNWRDVFAEQAAVFSALSLRPTACVLGSEQDAEIVRAEMEVAYRSDNLLEYETPTLQRLWEWCRANPHGSAMYVHTKGVSNPNDKCKAAWRRLMTRHVVGDWRTNLNRLAVEDMAGVDWQHSRSYPHFSGNFWMARADWIASLQSPDEYRRQGGPRIAGNPWDRMHAEMWIGSKPWHQVGFLCCQNVNLWCSDSVFHYLKQ
jgi:hypothetical protein